MSGGTLDWVEYTVHTCQGVGFVCAVCVRACVCVCVCAHVCVPPMFPITRDHYRWFHHVQLSTSPSPLSPPHSLTPFHPLPNHHKTATHPYLQPTPNLPIPQPLLLCKLPVHSVGEECNQDCRGSKSRDYTSHLT